MQNCRNLFVGILICVVGMVGWMSVGKAEAKKAGLRACLEQLATCQTTLDACEGGTGVISPGGGQPTPDDFGLAPGPALSYTKCLEQLVTCQTNLNTCEAGKSVVFPGDGQEGTSYDFGLDHGPALSYTDNDDGTFTDNNTHLLWEKKDTVPGSVHNVENTYQWSSIIGLQPDGSLFTTFLATLNTEPCFAGHCDWRIPTVKELQSIVDYSTGWSADIPATSVPGETFSEGSYWSSTSHVLAMGDVWVVHFGTGYVVIDSSRNYLPARAVRGGS